jgi:hypothetical protein
MDLRSRRFALLMLVVLVFQGCVAVHAPLQADESYPRAWGGLSALGPECKSLEGAYLNEGVYTNDNGGTQSLLLTSVLNIPSTARTVYLRVHTRKLGNDGGAFSTLRVIPEGDAAEAHELQDCFCIKQTLMCSEVSKSSWVVPKLGFGGSQSNVYFAVSSDRSLIAKLQNYHADVILVVPLFGLKEPWARFKNADQ